MKIIFGTFSTVHSGFRHLLLIVEIIGLTIGLFFDKLWAWFRFTKMIHLCRHTSLDLDEKVEPIKNCCWPSHLCRLYYSM